MGTKVGTDCKLYYGAAGSTPAGELTIARDVTLNQERGEADVTSRGSGGHKSYKPTLKDATLEFEIVEDTTNAGYTALRDAYLNGTAVALAARDGASGEGLDADWIITNFSRNEPLEDAVTVNVTARPNCDLRNPSWLS